MNNLYERIKEIYPTLTYEDFDPIRGQIVLQNNGDERGEYIARWDHPIYEKPTEDQLLSVVLPSELDKEKIKKRVEISESCRKAILSGFDSNALGTLHHYPSLETDQQNLTASVLASLLPSNDEEWMTPFWCADSSGSWEFRPHSALEIQQVGKDAKNQILMYMAKNEHLQGLIKVVSSFEELDDINW